MSAQHTPAQRKQIAAAFRSARPFLWSGMGIKGPGQTDAICFAIEKAMHEAAKGAIDVISERLGAHAFLWSWLVEQGISRSDMTPERMQAHRHAWLDLLIKEFES